MQIADTGIQKRRVIDSCVMYTTVRILYTRRMSSQCLDTGIQEF
ncbi:hypothetical protein [Wolbachia endosymbiont (group A) of Cheilosia soror]|nr:hypothetical protein [Wolbachia endosymbiont (group A) of Cheilosia soror]